MLARTLPLALLVGCHSTKPAPEDLDGLAHWYWQHYDGTSLVDDSEGADADLIAAAVNLDLALGGQGADAEDHLTGTVSDLSETEQATVPLDPPRDVSLSAGIFLTSVLPCTLDQIERIVVDLNQDELYPGGYDSYERVYTSDSDAYFARETGYLTWESTIVATVLGATENEVVNGGMRYVADDGTVDGAFGDMLVSRVYLPAPATYEDGSQTFDQDYQLEIYYPLSATEVVHFYPLWRQFDYGSGLDQDSATAQGVMMGALLGSEDDKATLCTDGF